MMCDILESWIDSGLRTQGNCSTRDAEEFAKGLQLDVSNQYHQLYDVDTNESDNDGDIDFSQFPFPNEIWIIKPTWEITVKTIAFLPIVIGGIWGNLAVLNVIRTNRLLRSAPTNLFIANMALCDLFGLLIGPWMLMCIDSFQNYVLGAFICKTEGFVQSSLLLGGVLSLTAVSCDRLVAIVFPRRPRLGPRAAWAVVFLTWIVGIAMSAPLVLYRHFNERMWCNFHERYCTENAEVLATYWNVIIALLVWLPLIVMLISYAAIFFKLERYTRQARKNPVSTATDFRARVTRMVLVLLVVFIVCRVPFTALIYIRNSMLGSHNQISEAFRILWFISHYLIYTNAAINPVIYGMTNDGFRSALRGAWPCVCCFRPRAPKPAQVAPATTPTPPALQPREPYHLEPCWRPQNPTPPAYTIETNDLSAPKNT